VLGVANPAAMLIGNRTDEEIAFDTPEMET
jgi:hypothetical protein